MKKIFVDLGLRSVGFITSVKSVNPHSLTILEGASIDDGAYSPPQHIWIDNDGLKNLYDALKAIYEPTVVG